MQCCIRQQQQLRFCSGDYDGDDDDTSDLQHLGEEGSRYFVAQPIERLKH